MVGIGGSLAMRAGNALNAATRSASASMERLATGKRINSARDDPAGLAIASTMTAQIRGMNQAIRNANDGISLAQTAEGSLNEVASMLQRIRELAVQSASGTYSDDDRINLQVEVTELVAQIGDILGNTKFNGTALFDASDGGSGTTTTLQTGPGANDTIELSIGNLSDLIPNDSGQPAFRMGADGLFLVEADSDALIGKSHVATADDWAIGGAPYPVVGQTYTLAENDVIFLREGTLIRGGGGLSVASQDDASNALATVDDMLRTTNTSRATLGATQSRLESVVSTLSTSVVNLSDARSRIEDLDYAAETASLARSQILIQASTAMLAQANQSQQSILQLLR